MDFRIAIPSHNRPQLIQDLTLAYLAKCNIPIEQIDVFVSNEQMAKEYILAGANEKCQNIWPTHTTNVRDKFNHIHSEYAPGTNVLVIEDDISSIDILAGYNMLAPAYDLFEHVDRGFNLCKQHNTKLWGICNNDNPFFLKEHAGFCFKMIVANMYGFIAEQPPILITQHTKTDYERTILYTQKYGGVIRLDYLCPRTRNYKNPGGMQDMDESTRAWQEKEASEYLAQTYPTLCKLNPLKTSSKYTEISLITKKVKPNNNTLF